MKNKLNTLCIAMVLILVILILIPWHKIIKYKLNLTRSSPIRISNIYIKPTDDWLVTEVKSSVNLNHEKKLILLSFINTKGETNLDSFIEYLNSKKMKYTNIKCKIDNKTVDGIEFESKQDNVVYNNLTIAFDKDLLVSVSYSRENNDANAIIVDSFLTNNIKSIQ